VLKAVGWGVMASIELQIFLFSVIEFRHYSTLSVALDPMKGIIGRGSSWLMGDNNSKEFRGYLIFITEPAEEPDKSQHYLAM
jgi:hypothetical protein